MRAAVFHGKEDLRVEDVPEPTPGPGQVKVQIRYAGICGSDVHTYFYPESNPFDMETPHPLTGAHLPQILGHELGGTIVELGEGVTDVKVGDRAAVFPIVATCGECTSCRSGVPMTCRLMASLGTNAHGGGLSEYVVVDTGQLHLIPESLELRMATLVEPMAVGWHAMERSGIQAGGTALLMGAGPIGIGAWNALRARGVEKLLVSEPNAERRATIEALGAQVIDPTSEDLAAAVAKLTDGEGMQVVIDAAGAPAAFTSGIASLAPRGRMVVVASYERTVEMLPTDLMIGEREIVGAVGFQPADWDGIIAAMAEGGYDTTGWVEERPLDDVVEALNDLRAGRGSKILIRMD